VRVGQLGIAAGKDGIDDLLAETNGLAHLDMRLADIVGVPVLRDNENADLDLALRQRALLVQIGADVLHAAGDGRRVDPDLVGAEDAAAAGDELLEHFLLFGRLLFRGQFEQAVHDEVLWAPRYGAARDVVSLSGLERKGNRG